MQRAVCSPYALHSAIISSHVSLGGMLALTLPPSDPMPLAALHSSRLHLSSPGLLSLHLSHSTSDLASSADEPRPAGVPSVALFANAISCHTTLTILTLEGLRMQDHGVLEFFPHLSQLSNLYELHVLEDRFFGPGLVACAEAVRGLP